MCNSASQVSRGSGRGGGGKGGDCPTLQLFSRLCVQACESAQLEEQSSSASRHLSDGYLSTFFFQSYSHAWQGDPRNAMK